MKPPAKRPFTVFYDAVLVALLDYGLPSDGWIFPGKHGHGHISSVVAK